MFCRSLFILLYCFIWQLCCLFTDSDYPFGIFTLFFPFFTLELLFLICIQYFLLDSKQQRDNQSICVVAFLSTNILQSCKRRVHIHLSYRYIYIYIWFVVYGATHHKPYIAIYIIQSLHFPK